MAGSYGRHQRQAATSEATAGSYDRNHGRQPLQVATAGSHTSFFLLFPDLFTHVSLHCIEDLIYVFPEMKLRSLIPNFYIHVSLDHYIFPRSVLLFSAAK
jgi:hypothetical protein